MCGVVRDYELVPSGKIKSASSVVVPSVRPGNARISEAMLRPFKIDPPVRLHSVSHRRTPTKRSDQRALLPPLAERVDTVTFASSSCQWCSMLAEAASATVLVEDAAFVIVDPGQMCCPGGVLTLVPRSHVSVLSELDSAEMAAVLAGLSRLLGAMKRVSRGSRVELRAHPKRAVEGTHLHFHAMDEGHDAAAEVGPHAEQVRGILEAMTR